MLSINDLRVILYSLYPKNLRNNKGYALLEFMLALTLSSVLLSGVFYSLKYYQQEEKRRETLYLHEKLLEKAKNYFLQNLCFPEPKNIQNTKGTQGGFFIGSYPVVLLKTLLPQDQRRVEKTMVVIYGVKEFLTKNPFHRPGGSSSGSQDKGKSLLCHHFFSYGSQQHFSNEMSKNPLSIHHYAPKTYKKNKNHFVFFLVTFWATSPKETEKLLQKTLHHLQEQGEGDTIFSPSFFQEPSRISFSQYYLYDLLGFLNLSCGDFLLSPFS